MVDGADLAADTPGLAQPQPKRVKYVFAGDVEMPQAASEAFARWAAWRDSAEATFQAFISDDQAAKLVGEYHVTLMNRRLDQAEVDKAVQWAVPSWEAHEALLAMALYETHAQWRLDMHHGCGRMEATGIGPECGCHAASPASRRPGTDAYDQVHA